MKYMNYRHAANMNAVIKTHESFHLQVGKPRCVECQTSGGADLKKEMQDLKHDKI